MIEKYIQKVNNNPFWGSDIIKAFYEGYGEKKCPLIIHYLILPIIMYKDTRQIFERITSKATLDNIIKQNALAFADLQDRIWKMERGTNMALINLDNCKQIVLKKDIEIKETIDYLKIEDDSKNILRSATYLGKVLSKYSTVDVFKILKVII